MFSPACHFDWVSAPAQHAEFGHWLGFDRSGCLGGEKNNGYLGPGGPVSAPSLYVASESGGVFSLESFVYATLLSGFDGLTVRSSKGGVFSTSGAEGLFTIRSFTDPEWKEVDWLVFDSLDVGVPIGFDNLVLTQAELPEPATLMLSFGALFSAFVASRPNRRRSVSKFHSS